MYRGQRVSMITSKANRQNSNYILIAQDDFSARQWQLSGRTAKSVIGLAAVLTVAALFFTADLASKFIYKNHLHEIQSHYETLTGTVVSLQAQLRNLNQQVGTIEARDEAVRTYADLPAIDSDVRQLGIGGVHLNQTPTIGTVDHQLDRTVADIEVDLATLSRKVRMELASYSTIYDKMVQDSEKMVSIPSIRPMEGGYMTSGFGYRKDPFDGKIRFHYGQDISARSGTPVYAPADGVVMEARYRGGFGKVIKVNHGHGYVTHFGHLNEFNVNKGQTIKRGELIGTVGNTGRSTGPHLHYEVHYYNTPQNPLDYFFSGYLN